MARTMLGSGVATFAFALALSIAASHAADTPCTFEQMQADPASVIMPCAEIIKDEAAPVDVRAEAFFVRGHGYARTTRTKLAAQDYDVAIKLSPMKSEYYVSRAAAEAKAGDYRHQASDLNRALVLDPRNAHALRALGALYELYGKQDAALEFYGRTLAIDAREPYALLNRIGIFKQRHQYAEALADADRLVAIPAPEINKLGYVGDTGAMQDFHAMALTTRSDIHAMVADIAAAETDLDAAIEQTRTPWTLTARANFRLSQRRGKDALADYREAVTLDPSYVSALYGRGLVMLGDGAFEPARQDFDRVVEGLDGSHRDDNTLASALRMRARTLRGLNRTDDAAESLEKAVAIDVDVRDETTHALVARGYWPEFGAVQTASADYKAALRACMIDRDCN